MKKPLIGIMLLLASAPCGAVESWEVGATDALTGIVPLGALWLTYNKDDKEGRKQYFWSVGTSLIVINSARLAFKDHEWATRPNGHPYGFPSGHLAFLGAGAAFLQDRYGWTWGVPAWAAAGYTAYVRVEDEHHRWRDVGVSAAVAFGVSKYFVTRYSEKTEVTVQPLLECGGCGVRVTLTFG